MLDSHENISDLNFTPGKPPQVVCAGELLPVLQSMGVLTPFQTEIIALSLLGGNAKQIQTLLENGACDLSYALGVRARFRVNIFSSGGQYSVVLRQLSVQVPTIKGMGLPSIFFNIAGEKNGLVFFTGATGVGKTTSLAAILDEINQRRSIHVVTLEDPIEYCHPQKMATFNQRELGTDFNSFANGFKSALRQGPRVIMVGEMRDRETVEIGLSAAETGHLVLASLHTTDAGQTIHRILGMFDSHEERLVRLRLAESLRWVVSQRLLPGKRGGRVAAFEILSSNLRTRAAIVRGESRGKTFRDIIEAGQGMVGFDSSILDLYGKDLITEATALAYASQKDVVGRGIDQIKAKRGETTSSIHDLEVDRGYGEEGQ